MISTYLLFFPVQGVIPGFTFPLSTVGRLGYITSPPTRPRFSHRDLRYYVPLRPPLPISGRFAFAPFPIPCCCLRLCPAGSGSSTASRCRSFVARALDPPVPLFFRLYDVQGDRWLSQVRELPLYAHAPVFDPGGVPHTCHDVFGTAAFQGIEQCRLFPLTRIILTDHHVDYFGIPCRGLRTHFPSASHTPFQGSHFGSATRLLARLWLGGIFTRWATSTSFNAYRHLPTFHISLGTTTPISCGS